MSTSTNPWLLACWLFTAGLVLAPTAHATHLESATGLNFQPEIAPSSTNFGTGSGSGGGGVNFSCNRPGVANNDNCKIGNNVLDPDKTPFLQEMVNADGVSYFHIIIGLPTDKFVQEVFIRAGGTNCFGFACSASTGTSGGGTGTFGSGSSGNGWNPLGTPSSGSGNGTGDPTRSIMKQVIDTPDMKQTFTKEKFANKPKITQDVITPEAVFHFSLDMSNSTYASSATPGVMVITANFTDPELAAKANFNSATDLQNVIISGGRFTFSQPSSTWFGGSTTGTFTHAGGGSGFNPATTDWQAFRDTSQNFNLLQSGNIGKTTTGGGGGFGGGF